MRFTAPCALITIAGRAMIVLGTVMVADGVGWILGRPVFPVG